MIQKIKSFVFVVSSFCMLHTVVYAANTTQQIFQEINTYRQQHGLAPLKLNQKVMAEAQQHSQDMADHQIPFGHSGFSQRTDRLRMAFPQSHAAAENVAYSYHDNSDVVQRWLESSGHRKNIEGKYNLTGIGIAADHDGRIYYTQIFVRNDN